MNVWFHTLNRPSSGSQMLKSPNIMHTESGYMQSFTLLSQGELRFEMDVDNHSALSPRLYVHNVISASSVCKIRSRPSSSPQDPKVEQQRGAFPASTRSRWRQDAHPDGGLRCITWNTRGLVGSVFSKQKNREFKLKYLQKPFDNNNILCLQEVHGRDEYLQAIQVVAPRFSFFFFW